MKGYNVYLALKAAQYKPYDDLQFLLIPTHCWKDLSIDIITSLLISIDWKGDNHNLIFIIINQLTKIVYYKSVKVTINTFGLAEVIVNVIVRYYGLTNSIVTNRELLFTLKFCSLLCYILGIKQKLSTAFPSQTDGRTKRQNSIMETYL